MSDARLLSLRIASAAGAARRSIDPTAKAEFERKAGLAIAARDVAVPLLSAAATGKVKKLVRFIVRQQVDGCIMPHQVSCYRRPVLARPISPPPPHPTRSASHLS